MVRVPQITLGWRLLTLAWGAVIFSWLMVEDDRVASVVVIGLGGVLLVVATNMMQRYGGQILRQRDYAALLTVMGLFVGGGSAASAAALMFLKTALHSHIYPDYPVGLMLAMLARIPAWGAAGALLGFSVWLLLLTRYGVSSESL
ncbi:hypothetical protein G4Y79_10980 [Phototrophicus methaneseepsis]|uniref:Uncharacterized protein n=1 Tax=Phototrophicus methaneseepsis TaxID=2710758 RepID=A0A7S8EDQ8_9CHLR|nr:hypothetical protein [Phototrophicus methaneseepsis]QPC84863.1 hypothetical protein G4Y79_10980 [Phototrophicus methaneseepsis]